MKYIIGLVAFAILFTIIRSLLQKAVDRKARKDDEKCG